MKQHALTLILCIAVVASGAGNIWQWQRARLTADKFDALAKTYEDALQTHSKSAEFTATAMARLQTMDEQRDKLSDKVVAGYERAKELIAAKDEYIAALEGQSASLQAEIQELKKPRISVVRQSAAPTVRRASSPAVRTAAAPDLSSVLAVVRRHADRHFSDGRKNGSGQTLVFALDVDLDSPREVPGWTGRYEVAGQVSYNYYDSIWGGSFSSERRRFTAQVEGGRVVDFSVGF